MNYMARFWGGGEDFETLSFKAKNDEEAVKVAKDRSMECKKSLECLVVGTLENPKRVIIP